MLDAKRVKIMPKSILIYAKYGNLGGACSSSFQRCYLACLERRGLVLELAHVPWFTRHQIVLRDHTVSFLTLSHFQVAVRQWKRQRDHGWQGPRDAV